MIRNNAIYGNSWCSRRMMKPNIFAGDLFRMVCEINAESKGWKVEVTDSEDSEAGGFSLITFKVTGQNAYGT